MYTVHNWSLKTNLDDFTVGEFESIQKIISDESLETIEKYFEIFEFLGMPSSIQNSLTDEEFFEIIKQFQIENNRTELVPSIELEGYRYLAYEGDRFILRARDLGLIEKFINKENHYISLILAVIFKREDLTNNEHYAPAHLHHKAKLMRELSMAPLYPYIIHITDNLNKNIKNHIESSENSR